MGITDIVSDYITAVILGYSQGIDKSKVSVSLKNLKLEIKDLELYKFAMMQHGLPIVIDRGFIGNIMVEFPAAIRIFEDATIIRVRDVTIGASCCCGEGGEFPPLEEMQGIRDHELKAHELFKKTFYNVFTRVTSRDFHDVFLKIVSKAVVVVENVKINVDFGKSPNVVFFGIGIKKLEIGRMNPLRRRGMDVEKAVVATDFAVFMGTDSHKIDATTNENLQSDMDLRFSEVTEFIIGPRDVAAWIHYNRKNAKLLLDFEMQDLVVDVKEWHLRFLVSLIPSYRTFQRRWKTIAVPRPDREDDLGMWDFVHQSACKLKERERSKFEDFVRLFRARSAYMRLVAKQEQDESVGEFLHMINHQLEYHQVIIFQLLAERRLSKWIRKGLSRNDVYDAMEFCDVDHKNLIQFFLRNAVLRVNSSQIACRLKLEAGEEVVVMSLLSPQIQVRMAVDGMNVVASFSSFQLRTDIDQVQYKMIESFDRDRMDFNFDITLCKPWTVFSAKIRASLNPNMILVNMENISNFFRRTTIMEYVKPVLACFDFDLRAIRPIFFDFEMKTAQIVLAARSQCHFNVVFDMFSLKSISQETTVITLSDMSLLFGSKIESVVLASFNFSGSYSNHTLIVNTAPVALSVYWSDMEKFIATLSQMLESIQFLRGFTKFVDLKLPDIVIEIGIPYVEITLDITDAESLLVLWIQTVTIDGQLPKLVFKGGVEEITMPGGSKLQKIGFQYEDGRFDLLLDYLQVSMFGLISVLPKDIMKFLSLNPLSVDFGFLFKKSKIDLKVEGIEEIVDFDVTNWRGKMNGSTLEMDGVVDSINFCGVPWFQNIPYNSSIELNQSININVHFGTMVMLFNYGVIPFALNTVFPLKDIFPAGLDFHWLIHIDNLSIPRALEVHQLVFQFTMNNQYLSAHLSSGPLDLAFGKCKGSHPLAISFDFNRKYFEIVTNLEELEVELNPAVVLVEKVLQHPFEFLRPLILDLRVLPMICRIRIEDKVFEMDMGYFLFHIDGERRLCNSRLEGISVKAGLRTLVTLEEFSLTAKDEASFKLVKGYLNVDKDVIKDVIQTVKRIRPIHCEPCGDALSETLKIPVRFSTDSYDIFVQNTMALSITRCNLLFNWQKLSVKTDWSVRTLSSFFESEELVQKTSCNLKWNVMDDGKVTLKSIPVIVTPESFGRVQSVTRLETRQRPPFVIVNNTDIDFVCEVGAIPKGSSLFYPDMPHFENFELQSRLGTIPFHRDSFEFGSEMKATFPTGESLVLHVKRHELRIDSKFEVRNSTRYSFNLQFGSLSQVLPPHSRVRMERQRGDFKLNTVRFCLHISSYYHVEVDNEFFSVCYKGSYVSIQPILFIKNALPFTIEISDEYTTVTIDSNAEKPCPFITPTSQYMNVSIYGGPITETGVKINLRKASSTITVATQQFVDMSICVQTKQKRGSYYVMFLATRVFHNHLTIPVYVSASSMTGPEERIEITDNTIFCPSTSMRQMHLYFSNTPALVDIQEKDARQQLLVGNESLCAFLDLVTKPEKKKFWTVVHVHLYPSYVIHNKTGMRLHILTPSSRIDIDHGIQYPVLQHDKSKDFAFSLDNSDYTRHFNLDKIKSQLTAVSTSFEPIYIDVRQKEDGKWITFKKLRHRMYRLINDTAAILSVGQSVGDQIEVFPYSSIFYTPISCDKAIKVWISQIEQTIELMPEASALPTAIGPYSYCSVRYPNGVTEIRLTDAKESVKCLPRFQFSTNISEIVIKMFSSDLVPLAMARIAGVHLVLDCSGECGINVAFKVDTLKSEDIANRQIFQDLQKSLFSLQTTLVGPRVDQFNDIVVDVNPFFFRFDPGFASHYLLSLMEMAGVSQGGSQSLIRFKSLRVNPSYFYFSFQCGMRVARPFPQAIRLLPAVLPFLTSTNAIALESFEGTSGELVETLAKVPVLSIRSFIFNAIGSANIIGAPWNYIARLVRGCKRRSKLLAPYVLTSGSIGVLIGIIESFLDYISSVLRFFSGHEITPKDLNSPLLWGLTSLFFAIVSGFMGSLQAPKQGWQEYGWPGVIYETIISLFQMVFVAGSGALDSISGILCFLRQLICQELDDQTFT